MTENVKKDENIVQTFNSIHLRFLKKYSWEFQFQVLIVEYSSILVHRQRGDGVVEMITWSVIHVVGKLCI